MIDVKQFHNNVIKPTLTVLGLGGLAAERLVLGTALVESGLKYLQQVPTGPARGFFQMEKATHKDLWDRFLESNDSLVKKISGLMIDGIDPFESMAGNCYYAAAMCRIHYYRIKTRLPDYKDMTGLAEYWKKYYNTELGAGKVTSFLSHADTIIAIVK